jgi:GDP-mannose pyrophosphatase NudK
LRERVRVVSEELLSDNWGTVKKTVLDLQLRNGEWSRQIRETYDRGDGAAILLCDPARGTVVLTRQFRFPAYYNGDSGAMIEVCAGKLEGDDPLTCAKKEAEEETGYKVTDIELVFDGCYMSPGSVTEKLSLFIARYDASARVSDGGGLAHEGEDIEVLEMPFETAIAMVASGDIADAKTIMLLQHAALTGLFQNARP